MVIINKLRKTGLFQNVSIGDEKRLQNTVNEFLQKNPKATLQSLTIDADQNIYIVCQWKNDYISVNNGNPTYSVHSAFFNGLSDRTTYFGLHVGDYDNASYFDALEVVKNRIRQPFASVTIGV